MILQLSPQIEMQTPKGHGFANFMIDRGMDFDIEWVVFLDDGQIWSFQNRDVRLEKNVTFSRNPPELERLGGVWSKLKRFEDNENPYESI